MPKKQWATYALAITVVGTLMALSWRQNERYQDPIALYRDTLKYTDCWLIHNNLGILLADTGDREAAFGRQKEAAKYWAEAIEHYQRTIKLKPSFSEAYNNLGNVLGKVGRLEEAAQHYQTALNFLGGIRPLRAKNIAQVENNLALTLARLGRLPEAIRHYQIGLHFMPTLGLIHKNLADALMHSGQPDEAIAHYREALRLEPNVPDFWIALGYTLYVRGQRPQAIEHFKRAIEIQPDCFQAYRSLILIYDQAGRTADAVATARRAIDVARAAGRTQIAEDFESWLVSCQAPTPEIPKATPAEEPAIPRP